MNIKVLLPYDDEEFLCQKGTLSFMFISPTGQIVQSMDGSLCWHLSNFKLLSLVDKKESVLYLLAYTFDSRQMGLYVISMDGQAHESEIKMPTAKIKAHSITKSPTGEILLKVSDRTGIFQSYRIHLKNYVAIKAKFVDI
ncbi:MAG: hypothetical protein GY804_09165 [Alphaproteobacteria bacterium]|nr:hypothetical protein [Alphaproteobacteria bacterium]